MIDAEEFQRGGVRELGGVRGVGELESWGVRGIGEPGELGEFFTSCRFPISLSLSSDVKKIVIRLVFDIKCEDIMVECGLRKTHSEGC